RHPAGCADGIESSLVAAVWCFCRPSTMEDRDRTAIDEPFDSAVGGVAGMRSVCRKLALTFLVYGSAPASRGPRSRIVGRAGVGRRLRGLPSHLHSFPKEFFCLSGRSNLSFRFLRRPPQEAAKRLLHQNGEAILPGIVGDRICLPAGIEASDFDVVGSWA